MRQDTNDNSFYAVLIDPSGTKITQIKGFYAHEGDTTVGVFKVVCGSAVVKGPYEFRGGGDRVVVVTITEISQEGCLFVIEKGWKI